VQMYHSIGFPSYFMILFLLAYVSISYKNK
jgi:hypothetical protein